MKLTPTVPVGLQDNKLITYLTQVARALKNHPDHQCYTVTVVWTVPFVLQALETQNVRPSIVRLGNAQLTNAPETVVEWGAGTTWLWQGNGQIKILNQAGLLEGVKYTLTWEVVS